MYMGSVKVRTVRKDRKREAVHDQLWWD
jgi:hypothetical protein